MTSVWPQTSQPVQPIIFQPTTTNTTIIMQQSSARGRRARPWNSGIFGCCDDITSCLIVSVLCPFSFLECYGCYLSIRMRESCLLSECVPCYLMALRTKLRTEHNIEGGICNDCIVTNCCRPCAMCQMTRELDDCNS